MDFDLRLKALARLAQSTTEAAEAALKKEIEKAAVSLGSDTAYEQLDEQLRVLDAIGYRFSKITVKTVLSFIRTIESRGITYQSESQLLISDIEKYRNSETLIVQALDILIHLRYHEIKSVLNALIGLSRHSSEMIRKKAFDGLELLATYDIDVFFGDDKHPGFGAMPQKEIIGEIEQFTNDELKNNFSAVLILISGLLSPTMHGSSSTYKTVTWSRAETPARFGISDIRVKSINALKRMFAMVEEDSQKLAIINTLNDATRRHDIKTGNAEALKTITQDTLNVLEFFSQLISTESLQVIQKIETSAYWMYFHAFDNQIRDAAREVETKIANHAEYQIYKVLIGFERIFGDWEDLRKNDSSSDNIESFRNQKAAEYAASITPESYPIWHDRIMKYSETQSDDLATFPNYYYFLELFAVNQPRLALQLISTDADKIDRFLIPLLRGLWKGPERESIRALMMTWIQQGRYLGQMAKQFLANEQLDREMLSSILHKAAELGHIDTIVLVMSVAISNYSDDTKYLIDECFLPALEVLTKRSNADWIFGSWFRRQTKLVITELDDSAIDRVLLNLFALDKIDYHAEEILYLIAQRSPRKVLEFLCERIRIETQKRREKGRVYDAIPYELHKLNEPLSRNATETVNVIRSRYRADDPFFLYREAHLLKNIFPHFPQEFERELLKVVRAGTDDDIGFVLTVLRNYNGQPFVHTVCKEIIKSVPEGSPLRTEVAIALEGTGAVFGEFGLAEAYEQKVREIREWLNDPDERIQLFTKWYIGNLEQMSSAERKRAEERIELRKFEHGA